MATLRERTFGKKARVFALVVAGLLLLIYGVYQVGKIFDVFASRYTIVTLVESAAGLREGAPVTLAGQQVGQVSDIDFVPMSRKLGNKHLRVEIAISDDVKEQIRRDSRLFIRAQGLLGDKYMDIAPGTSGAAILQPGDTIESETMLDIEQFLARGAAVLDTATRAIADLRDITGSLVRGEGTLGRMLTDEQLYVRLLATTSQFQTTLETLNRADGTFARLMRDPELYNTMLSAVDRVDKVGAAVLNGDGTLGKLLTTDSLYRSIAATASRADSTLAGFSGLFAKVHQGNGTVQRFLTDPTLYDEVLKTIVDFQTVIQDMRANPKKYVPPVQVKVF